MVSARRALHRFGWVVALTLVAFLAVALVAPQPVGAATITINAGFDVIDPNDGFCNFREAIISANTNAVSGPAVGECIAGSPGADTITTPGGMGLITLTSALPTVTENLTVAGVGLYTLDAVNLYRIFDIPANVSFTISNFTLTNGRVAGLGADEGGAAIRKLGAGDLTVTDVFFIGNVAVSDGIGFNNSGGAILFNATAASALKVTGSVFRNNTAEFGGAVYVRQGTLQLTGGLFETNTASIGGGAVNTGLIAGVTVSGTFFITNTATSGNGGAFSVNADITLIENATFNDNKATAGDSGALRSGGAVGATIAVSGSTFRRNESGARGGAISGGAALTLNGGTFENNKAGTSGGAVDLSSGPHTIAGTTFTGNQATADGGAISYANGLSLTVQGGTVIGAMGAGNIAARGGGIFADGARLIVDASIVAFNTTTGGGNGGGIYGFTGPGVTVRNGSQIFANNATGSGGGIYMAAGPLTVTDSTIGSFDPSKGNKAQGGVGGGIAHPSMEPLTITTTNVTNNQAVGGGGGGVLRSNSGTTTITGSAFVGNSAGTNGGGLRLVGGTSSITNSTIANNTAVTSGGVAQEMGTLSLQSVSVRLNSVTTPGLGANVSDFQAMLTVRNSIIATPIGDTNCNVLLDVATNNLADLGDTSCFARAAFDRPDANGNIVTLGAAGLNPFGLNGGTTLVVDLIGGSRAHNAAANAPATDQRGVMRPQGAGSDIGAYETGNAALAITPAGPFVATVGVPFSQPLAVTNGFGPFTVQLGNQAGDVTALPPGLSVNAMNQLVGSPTQMGVFAVVLRVTDTLTNIQNTQQFTVTVSQIAVTGTSDSPGGLPNAPHTKPGGMIQLSVISGMSDLTPVSTYSSSDPNRAVVDAGGRVRAFTPGLVTITATYMGVATNIIVTVDPIGSGGLVPNPMPAMRPAAPPQPQQPPAPPMRDPVPVLPVATPNAAPARR